MVDKSDSGVLGQGFVGRFRFGSGYTQFEGLAKGLRVRNWLYGTVQGTTGVINPFFWDNPLSTWDSMCWDVNAIGSSIGITERVPAIIVASATVFQTTYYMRSGQVFKVSVVMS